MLEGQFYPYTPFQFEAARPWYRAEGINFDGTNDYLTRGAGLTGAADSKLGTGSLWYRTANDGVTHRIVSNATTVAGATGRIGITKPSDNRFQFIGVNAAGVTIINILTTIGSVLAAGGWRHFLFSFDLANVANRHVYLDGVSDLVALTYTNDAIDYTVADWSISGRPNGADKCDGDLADLMFWPGVYTDFSLAANRGLFISPNGKPVEPTSAIAALGTPLMRFSGPVASWHTNKGSGGGFTLNGALTASTDSPSN